MTVINMMLGRERGGLEQAAIDYAEALTSAGIPSLHILSPDSWASKEFDTLGLPWTGLEQRGGWDIFAACRLKHIAVNAGASAAICHGNRALSMALLSRAPMQVIGVTHNYRTRRFYAADAALAITLDARERLIETGMPPHRVHYVPNMVRVGDLPVRAPRRTPPLIGTMGRFMAKKGFDIFLDALAILHREGVAFQAILGGDGPEEHRLRQRIALRELNDHVTMPSWIEDKKAWFAGIDIFVLPSHHEPFGIVLIEAMAAGVPVVSSDAVGPREIIRDGEDGLLFPVADAEALAERLRRVLDDPEAAKAMGERGHARVYDQFSEAAMVRNLKHALGVILTGN